MNNRHSQVAPSLGSIMSGVTAYFDLDGTLLDASSEKHSLACYLVAGHGEFQSEQRCGL